MYVIITGSGIVGFHIASLLAEGKHEVAVIDPSREVIDSIHRQLDVRTVQGNAATPSILREAEVSRANLVIAVTNNDETNMLICFLAKELGAAMTVARVRNPEYSGYFVAPAKSPTAARKVVRPKTLGIDVFINPEVEVAEQIMGALSSFYPSPVESFADGRVQIREFRVDEGALAGKRLREASFPRPCVVAGILREGGMILPGPSDKMQPGDHIYLVAQRDDMDEFGKLFARPRRPVRSVAIYGGGRVGFLVASGLERKGLGVKVIAETVDQSQEIAAHLERASVLEGDATDREFLIEQGIPSVDAFVSATASDELNILCGLLAKSMGVPRSLVITNKPGYVPLAEAVGVDLAVSPLLQVASRISHFVLHGGAISAPFIAGKELQAMEFVTSSTAHAAHRSMAEAGLPNGSVAAAIVRDDRVIIPPDDNVIQPGDHVLIVARPSATLAVERLFK